MAPPELTIGQRRIGPGHPVYIIAEMSANHGGDYDLAVKTVEAAKRAGADAIKLQTYTPDTMTIACDKPPFLIGKGTIWEGRNLYDLYGEAHTPWEWQPKLKELADGLGLDFFSTAFDATAVDFLDRLDVPVHKIASFEIVDIPLIEKMARAGKPMILSTGMASEDEVDEAVAAARGAGATSLALLKCTSAYPAPAAEMRLRAIAYLAERYELPVGLSDHTLGTSVPIAAVTLGACIVEKHFTLSRSHKSADASFSIEPDELALLVDQVRATEQALGEARLGMTDVEKPSRVFRRSLFVVADVEQGELFTEANLRSIRPGDGLPPKHYRQILGQRAACDVERGTPLSWSLVAGGPGGKAKDRS